MTIYTTLNLEKGAPIPKVIKITFAKQLTEMNHMSFLAKMEKLVILLKVV
jgi:hypothetical protein